MMLPWLYRPKQNIFQQFPNFTQVWNETTTACDYNGLKCLSTVKGNFLTKLDILDFGGLQLMPCYARHWLA